MLTNKTVIVSGAASGIGRACAQRLITGGNQVIAVDLDGDRLQAELGDETDTLKLVPGDVAKSTTAGAAAQTAVDAFGRVDCLAHFAAAHSKLNWELADEDEFNRILSINVTGSFLMAKAAANVMIDQAIKGSMVLTASGGVLMGGTGENGRGGPAYTTSKGGVLVLVRTLAKSWGKYGIRVNAISPGVVETAMTSEYSNEAMQGAAARAALGRVSQPEEQAAAAIWLLSEEAGFITGENTNINGGAAFG
ncbi:MAG: SDR family oxidoreductase [Pseudomonadota bacterium]|nr:SDR family oxidoreductase [Pseudomonadota bacterium]